MARRLPKYLIAAAALAVLLAGCSDSGLTDAERRTVASMSLSALPPLPPDPTNRFADEPGAAALGATLFFDTGMSRDGNVACGTCHKIDRQFQDDLPRGVGVGVTNRRTMPLAGVARDPFFFWDGRRDSLWAQALVPLENPVEHAGTRTAYAHYIKRRFGERYERIFRPMPAGLDALPASAGPFGTPAEQAAWKAMTEEQRSGVDQVFADVGKAIAAFERSLVHGKTRFDRFADGNLSPHRGGMQQGRMNQAFLHRLSHRLQMGFIHARHFHMNRKAVKARGILRLLRGDLHVQALRGKPVEVQVIRGVEGRAGSQRREQQFGRSHPAVGTL